MNGKNFDQLAIALSRKQVLTFLGTSVLAVLFSGVAEARKKKHQHRGSNRKRCIPHGRKCPRGSTSNKLTCCGNLVCRPEGFGFFGRQKCLPPRPPPTPPLCGSDLCPVCPSNEVAKTSC